MSTILLYLLYLNYTVLMRKVYLEKLLVRFESGYSNNPDVRDLFDRKSTAAIDAFYKVTYERLSKN